MIIAVDFDGVLCSNKFPEIGEANTEIVESVKQLIQDGHEVVLWTTRNGEELTAAVDWCGERGLHFCNVNGPAPSNAAEYRNRYPTESRKIYADVYIDDHSIEYVFEEFYEAGRGKEIITRFLKKGVKIWREN